jgi:hypothetical protein
MAFSIFHSTFFISKQERFHPSWVVVESAWK